MRSFILLLAVLVVFSTTSMMAQSASGNVTYSVTLAAVPLAVTGGTTTYTNLVRGVKYTVSADFTLITGPGLGIVPVVNTAAAEDVSTTTPSAIVGDAGANILVSFTLPTLLTDATTGYSLPITYGPYSASWSNSIAATATTLFDPRTPTVVPLDLTGAANVYLMGDVSVPISAPATAVYAGFAVLTVTYTGF